jgi:UDP-N-acetylmuramoyl-L-alanyl-D-glutamate--2,6-diaminopimelate ligase
LMVESRHVRLADVFKNVKACRFVGSPETHVSALAYRSDLAKSGALFFCVPGFVRDGHDYAPDAVERGAAALCVERPLNLAVAQVVVPSVRKAMGPAAAAFYGHPSSRLLTVGVTGTNGKTTSAFLVAHLLDEAGLRAGLMGTIERRIGGLAEPAARTTPEALDIQRDFASMLEAGDRAAVMEVSSHALDLSRVLGIDFRVVAFTNLTQDHLDYHETLEAYFEAKRALFVDPVFTRSQRAAVINVDDEHGRRLASEYPAENLLTFSTATTESREADLVMRDYAIRAMGTTGTLELRGNALRRLQDVTTGAAAGPAAAASARSASTAGDASRPGLARFAVDSRLVGAFNVANILTALGIGLGLGLDMEGMLAALRRFPGVPGRMEPVDAGQQYAVLVDYAHTPDSVRNVLRTARAITSGRLIAVLGCGGDRDIGKRPHMGREAEALADRVVITSDNPRSEDPEAIIGDILSGIASLDGVIVEPDRREAIRAALSEARPGDVVLILGKGHESGQEFADRKIPFDDRLVARDLIEELRGAAG